MIKNITNTIILENTSLQYVEQLEGLQRKVFSTLSEEEIMTADIYRQHIARFPEGQFLIRDGENVIGMTSTMIYDLVEGEHTFLEISGNLTISTHKPNADWLYGLDVGIDPDYRGMGLARHLYSARQDLCRKLHLKGQFTAGMPIGYDKHRNEMSMETYFEKLCSGELIDPTVSMQQKIGFELKGLIPNYLTDEKCANYGVLMILPVEKEV